ncbi:MAG TPA: flagellar biosynthetic protein FliO [Polyangia bacterium]|jgi:flagellar biosynthetic protein FliO|nr:flagellar biosynthetic protein FliO [Polyangia bacterium]
MGETALPSFGWDGIALSFVSLGVVCLVAWLALRFLAGRGVGRPSGAVRVLARCPLEPRRAVYLIEAAGRCFLVGVGDGPMSLLAEVDSDKAKAIAAEPPSPSGVAEILGRVFHRPPADPRP